MGTRLKISTLIRLRPGAVDDQVDQENMLLRPLHLPMPSTLVSGYDNFPMTCTYLNYTSFLGI